MPRLILQHFNGFGNACSLVNYFTQDLDHLSWIFVLERISAY